MRRLLTMGLLLSATTLFAQTAPPATPETPAHPPDIPATELPDAPGEPPSSNNVVVIAEASWKATGGSYERCSLTQAMRIASFGSKSDSNKVEPPPKPCNELF